MCCASQSLCSKLYVYVRCTMYGGVCLYAFPLMWNEIKTGDDEQKKKKRKHFYWRERQQTVEAAAHLWNNERAKIPMNLNSIWEKLMERTGGIGPGAVVRRSTDASSFRPDEWVIYSADTHTHTHMTFDSRFFLVSLCLTSTWCWDWGLEIEIGAIELTGCRSFHGNYLIIGNTIMNPRDAMWIKQ